MRRSWESSIFFGHECKTLRVTVFSAKLLHILYFDLLCRKHARLVTYHQPKTIKVNSSEREVDVCEINCFTIACGTRRCCPLWATTAVKSMGQLECPKSDLCGVHE